jgi:hypothetical protein
MVRVETRPTVVLENGAEYTGQWDRNGKKSGKGT